MMNRMSEYREIAPAPPLAGSIECFWTLRIADAEPLHRVLPDGCADILLTRDGDRWEIAAVGPMTRYRDFVQPAGRVLVGRVSARACGPRTLECRGHITDAIVPLTDIWGERARELQERLTGSESLDGCVRILEDVLPAAEEPSPMQKALAWMAKNHGCVSIDDLAAQAGLSARQFRRLCVELSGLTPKFLARVLRFRRALQHVARASLRLRPPRAGLRLLRPGAFDQRIPRAFRPHPGGDRGWPFFPIPIAPLPA